MTWLSRLMQSRRVRALRIERAILQQEYRAACLSLKTQETAAVAKRLHKATHELMRLELAM